MRYRRVAMSFILLGCATAARAADANELKALLAREVIGPRTALAETQDYLETRLPKMPEVKTAVEWDAVAAKVREDVLAKVVYRGEASAWRDAKAKVEWLETIASGPGYKIKKLRYEAVPGLWIPALLYEPEKLSGKVPAVLNVNGHDGAGKAASYKQLRCINLAKRGMLALNLEWLGMGQLRGDGYAHTRMNQLDLCGTSGLAPFYLNMKCGLDVLLAHENADSERVAVTGLSGGGWQTIYISSLDMRVKLTNPVAGYSSFRTRVRHFKDLGDSEQTPCDMATVADYDHLTAMMAPRPTLLTYNSKDNCCFESGYVLPQLLESAGPLFKLHDKEKNLRTHVNDDPGDHNYGLDNRQAFYRMVGDHFFTGDTKYDAKEIPSDKEVKTKEELAVELPAGNADFHTLAVALAKKLPRSTELPTEKPAAVRWQAEARKKLRDVVKATDLRVKATKVGADEKGDVRTTYWKLRLGDTWTVPVVELVQGEAKGTTVLVGDAGRAALAEQTGKLLTARQRVLAVDPWYFGESKMAERDWLWALLIATIGDRPLGLQASQMAAVARWGKEEFEDGLLTVVAVGPRSSLFALVAAGLEEEAISGVEMHGALGTLKEVIKRNGTVNATPEQFCFGLLEVFDVKHMAALVAPRPATFPEPTERVTAELAGLKAWYATLGSDFNPLP
jgi:hypothetical protein